MHLTGSVALAVVVVSLLRAEAPTGQTPDIEVVMSRAAGYVARFVEIFSNVVATERYVQEIATEARVGALTGSATIARTRRDLRSEFLLLKVGGLLEWRPFRDVFEVDGRVVRERNDRLSRLFLTPSASASEQAARIAQDSARYNLGPAGRTVNTPVLSLLFLQSHIQPRFRFGLDGRDAGLGPTVWRVTYQEATTPTLIRGLTTDENRDLPSSGRFWIDVETGRVLRSQLTLSTVMMTAEVGTTFRDDARFGIAVPVEMREEYTMAEDTRTRQRARTITGFARYDEFRRFAVSTDTTIAPSTP